MNTYEIEALIKAARKSGPRDRKVTINRKQAEADLELNGYVATNGRLTARGIVMLQSVLATPAPLMDWVPGVRR